VPSDIPDPPQRSLVADSFLGALRFQFRVASRLRAAWLRLRLRAAGAHVGKRLSVGRGVQVITTRGAIWHLGDGVSLGRGVIITVGQGARLQLGDDVRISPYVLIGATTSIVLSDRASVGEHSSIRDHEHDVAAPSMRWGGLVGSPVLLGEDCWIARGVAVLRGSRIGAGAVIGANAVVRGYIPDNALAVGVPARVIRYRDASPRDPVDSGPREAHDSPADELA
jgi:acetyltransferase-like isoleucine patch superfamily enzyme